MRLVSIVLPAALRAPAPPHEVDRERVARIIAEEL